ncbi:MAG: arylsulfatase [Saprospiraceae bacterium]|nr:MAG: arylsulfatase [Saprospiraceae bacterium]
MKIYRHFFLLILFFVYAPNALSAQANQPPNVILILADDMGLGDISLHNQGLNRTPNIDQLIQESAWFSRAYSGSPVCTPSRAALLTGHYPHRTGAISLNMEKFPELSRIHLKERTMGDIFTANGYVTGLVGKWHSGDGKAYHPMRRGFQEFVGFKGYDVEKSYFNYNLDIQGIYQEVSGEYLTDKLTDHAIDFVRRHQQEPFFLHLAHYAPHRPLSAPEALIEAYLKKGFDKNTASVYAMIEVMDRGIGELMAELDKLKIRENTIVIFASDNGPDPVVGERFNHEMKGTKYTVDEGGIHVPLLINWPTKIAAKEYSEVIHFTDVLPTLAAMCQLNLPGDLALDGGSFAGLLFDKHTQLPQYRYWQWNRGVPYYSHNAAMLEGDWKLVRPYVMRNVPLGESVEKPVLYNLKNDPQEKTDLSAQESDRYHTMLVKLEEWCRRVEYSRMAEE